MSEVFVIILQSKQRLEAFLLSSKCQINNTVSVVSELLFYFVLTATLLNIYRVLKKQT